MILTDVASNLYFSMYGPCEATIGGFRLREETQYPFRDTIKILLDDAPAAQRTLFFRIPGWCKDASIVVNGESVISSPEAGVYCAVDRLWKPGDVIELTLPMNVCVSRVDDTDGGKRHPLTVEYGPLLFSLPIPEQWNIIPGRPHTVLPEDWHWYDITPVVDLTGFNPWENMGMNKYRIGWNVAIDEQISSDDIQVEFVPSHGYVWEEPNIRLKVPAYKALFSYPPYNRMTPEVCSPIAVQEPLEIELVPYGCTNLRISYFPRADV